MGGGIYVRGGSATLTNSTVSGNSALAGGGTVSYYYGATRLYNSTIAENAAGSGGGHYAFIGSLHVVNSVIANNGGGDCYYISGTFSQGGVNLVESDSFCAVFDIEGWTRRWGRWPIMAARH